VHGLVFTSFQEFLATRSGTSERDTAYARNDAYPDEEFHGLVARASEATGLPTGELLREFGIYAANVSFANLFPAAYAEASDTRGFLLTVEQRIHELVRATIPGAQPPRLNVRPLGERGVCITYTSDRGLCDLLEGLVAGTARYYGETFAIEEIMCMRDGGLACTFLVEPA
jgi:hypothetical protein